MFLKDKIAKYIFFNVISMMAQQHIFTLSIPEEGVLVKLGWLIMYYENVGAFGLNFVYFIGIISLIFMLIQILLYISSANKCLYLHHEYII